MIPRFTTWIPKPHGPFPESTALTDSGDIRIVPIPGHSIAQVGVLIPSDGVVVFFGADHVLRQDWFVEDYAKGRLVGLGLLGNPKLAVETSRRIQRFAETVPTVFLPAHDAGARRLVALELLKL